MSSMIEEEVLFPTAQSTLGLELDEDVYGRIFGFVMMSSDGLENFYRCLRVSKSWNRVLQKDFFYFKLSKVQVALECLISKYNQKWLELCEFDESLSGIFWKKAIPQMILEAKRYEWLQIKEDLDDFDKRQILLEWKRLFFSNWDIPNTACPPKSREQIEDIAKKNSGNWMKYIPFIDSNDWISTSLIIGGDRNGKESNLKNSDFIEKELKKSLESLEKRKKYFEELEEVFQSGEAKLKANKQIVKSKSISRVTSWAEANQSSSKTDDTTLRDVIADVIRIVVRFSQAKGDWQKDCSLAIRWLFQWLSFGGSPEFKDDLILKIIESKFKRNVSPKEVDILEAAQQLKVARLTSIFDEKYKGKESSSQPTQSFMSDGKKELKSNEFSVITEDPLSNFKSMSDVTNIPYRKLAVRECMSDDADE